MWVMWNLVSICLETLLVLVQDRCKVCAKCTTGLEIMLEAPESTIGSEIILDAPDANCAPILHLH
jgi:hypothetical protein